VDEFDLYVWRRCGCRVVMSARAKPRPEVRAFVSWLDCLHEHHWGELVSLLPEQPGLAGDWLEDHGQDREYARQLLVVPGAQGPRVHPAPLHDSPVIREIVDGDETVYCEGDEAIILPAERPRPGEQAPGCRTP
jgi:hypothetical protein